MQATDLQDQRILAFPEMPPEPALMRLFGDDYEQTMTRTCAGMLGLLPAHRGVILARQVLAVQIERLRAGVE